MVRHTIRSCLGQAVWPLAVSFFSHVLMFHLYMLHFINISVTVVILNRLFGYTRQQLCLKVLQCTKGQPPPANSVLTVAAPFTLLLFFFTHPR